VPTNFGDNAAIFSEAQIRLVLLVAETVVGDFDQRLEQ
jgi:hypothetical protein